MFFVYPKLKRYHLIIWGVLSTLVFFNLAILMGIYLFNSHQFSPAVYPSWFGRRSLLFLSMIELFFVFFAIPLMISIIHPVIKKKWRLPFVVVLPVVIPSIYLYTMGIHLVVLLKLGLTLFFIIFFITSVHQFVFSLSRDLSVSIVVNYLVFISLISGVMLMNPVIEWINDPSLIIQATLLLNPLIGIASSIDLDILRMYPLYSLSSIGVFQFHYPAPMKFWFVYGTISFVLWKMGDYIGEEQRISNEFLVKF